MSDLGKPESVLDLWAAKLDGLGVKFAFYSGALHAYREGVWYPVLSKEREAVFDHQMYKACLGVLDYGKHASSLWKTAQAKFQSPVIIGREGFMVFTNGTLDLSSRELVPHSPDHGAVHGVEVPYDKKARCPKWLGTVGRAMGTKISDSELKVTVDFLQEWFGAALVGGSAVTRNREFRKALLLYGPSRTGKTVIADIVRVLFGVEHVASSTMTELGQRFGVAALLGKRALISDEGVSLGARGSTSILKRLVTGDWLELEEKYKPTIPFRFDGPMLFTSNALPRFEDSSRALYDRWLVFRFDHVFQSGQNKRDFPPHGEHVRYFRERGELSGIVNWALRGYDRLVARGNYVLPESVGVCAKDFRQMNDPLYDFASQYLEYADGSYCDLAALAHIMSAFARERHGSIRPVASFTEEVRAHVIDTVPGLRVEAGAAGPVVLGARLTPPGMLLWSAIKGDIGTRGVGTLTVNGQSL